MKGLFRRLFKGEPDTESITEATTTPEAESGPAVSAPTPVKLPEAARTLTVIAGDAWTASLVQRVNTGMTLVALQTDATIGPAAAVAWQESGARWTFQLRPEIRAIDYREHLLTCLSELASRRMSFPPFERLIGYGDFVKGAREAIGITVSSNTLSFEFSVPTGPGFLETLTAPDLAIGPCAYFSEPGGAMNLRRTKDFPNVEFDRIVIQSDGALTDNRRQTVYYGEPLSAPKSGFKSYADPAQLVGTFVVRPARDMQNQRYRQILADQLTLVQARKPAPGASAFLFPDDASPIEKRTPHPRKVRLTQGLRVQIPAGANSPSLVYMEECLTQALKELGWPFAIDRVERFERPTANADIRVQLDAASTRLENWGYDHFFLSPLGPQYPDPSGRIKQAMREFSAGTLKREEFSREMNQSLHDDAAVLPVLRTSRTWLYSDDLKHFSPQLHEVR